MVEIARALGVLICHAPIMGLVRRWGQRQNRAALFKLARYPAPRVIEQTAISVYDGLLTSSGMARAFFGWLSLELFDS